MRKKYLVTLDENEVKQLTDILHKGRHSAQVRNRAQVLLHVHNGWKDEKIAENLGMSLRAIESIRRRFVEEGFETVLNGKPRGHRPLAIDGRIEAHLIALTCSEAPEGHKKWTLRLLRDHLVATEEELDSLSHETVRQTLKKTKLSLGKR